MSGITAAIIGGGASLLTSGFKFLEGANQRSQARRIAANNPFQPEAMPAEVELATRLARDNYTNGMPGMSAAQQGISQSAGNAGAVAAKGATSGGDLIDAANKIQLNSDDASRQLAMQAASYKSNALGGYEAALGQQAGWKDQLYKNNQLQPYLRQANTAASLEGAGAINEAGALDSAATGIEAGMQDYTNAKMYNKLAQNPNGMNINQLIALASAMGGRG